MAAPLSQAFLRMRNADPEGFEGMVNSFSDYLGQAFLALAKADANDILGVQGQVRMGQAVLRMMQECHLPPRTKPEPTPL